MSVVRLLEFPVSSKEMINTTFYKGEELIEGKVNTSFFACKEMISQIGRSCDEFSIIYDFSDDVLRLFIKIPDSTPSKAVMNSIPSSVWSEQGKDTLKRENHDKGSHVKLEGLTNPLVASGRRTNLIDEIVDSFVGSKYRIEIKITKRNDRNEYIRRMNQVLRVISEKVKITKSQLPNIVVSIIKTFVGGKLVSYAETHNYLSNLYKGLLDNFLLCSRQDLIFNHEIEISSEDSNTANQIANKMISFARSSSVPDTNFLGFPGDNDFILVLKKEDASSKPINKDKEAEEENKDSLKEIRPWEFRAATADVIATFAAFPALERPGLKTREFVRFGQNVPKSGERVSIGKLQTNTRTNIEVAIHPEDLARHAFVCGVTGSGKTSTIKSLLAEGFRKKIPFLVIEPAKTEYKHFGPEIKTDIYNLGTLGDSFRLNPFYFPEGVQAQTHIDLLKSIFISSFPMYGPMPYILETAIVNVYKERGWDLGSSANIYRNQFPAAELYPTLSDLHSKIEEATIEAGYSTDLSNDIRGALKVRIASLMNGAKGFILNNKETMDFEKLLKSPSIVELEQIGDNQEKAFFMGLILTSIYEHYISKGHYSRTLKHLIVFEEAHRLLENTSKSNNPEISDMKGAAVETFTNILSEIRAYGEGIIVADQIPSKLSPDVVKNTNLKIVHRLFAKDDREFVGNSIGLQQDQIEDIVHLRNAQAVVFFDELDKAVKVNINDASSLTVAGKTIDREQTVLPANQKTVFAFSLTCFRNQLLKMIRTLILFPEKAETIRNHCEAVFKENTRQDASDNDINQLVKTAATHLAESNLKELLKITYSIRLKSEIKECENPFEQIPKIFKDQADKSFPFKNPLGRFSEIVPLVTMLFKPFLNKTDELLVLTAKFTRNDKHAALAFLNTLGIADSVELELLNENEISELSSAAMLCVFRDRLDILELYFDIDTTTIAEYYANNHIADFDTKNRILTDISSGLKGIAESISSGKTLLDEHLAAVDNLKKLTESGQEKEKPRDSKWLLYLLGANILMTTVLALLTLIK